MITAVQIKVGYLICARLISIINLRGRQYLLQGSLLQSLEILYVNKKAQILHLLYTCLHFSRSYNMQIKGSFYQPPTIISHVATCSFGHSLKLRSFKILKGVSVNSYLPSICLYNPSLVESIHHSMSKYFLKQTHCSAPTVHICLYFFRSPSTLVSHLPWNILISFYLMNNTRDGRGNAYQT